jgi:hypothetical protein
VSLGLLCESRTQVWGTTKYISGEIGEQGWGGRREWRMIMCLLRQYYGLNL